MQYHNYIFFSVNPDFYSLPITTQKECKEAFLKAVLSEKTVISYAYTTLGLKAGSSILIWFQAESTGN